MQSDYIRTFSSHLPLSIIHLFIYKCIFLNCCTSCCLMQHDSIAEKFLMKLSETSLPTNFSKIRMWISTFIFPFLIRRSLLFLICLIHQICKCHQRSSKSLLALFIFVNHYLYFSNVRFSEALRNAH